MVDTGDSSFVEADSDPQLQALLHELSPTLVVGGIFSIESESALQGLLANEEVRRDCLTYRQIVALLGHRGLLGSAPKPFGQLATGFACSEETMRIEYWRAVVAIRRYYKSVEIEAVSGQMLFAHMLPE